MRKRPLFLIACVFLTGLAYQRYHAGVLWIFLIGILGVEVFCGFKHNTRKLMAGRSIILLSAFLIGMVHMQKEEGFRDAYMSKIVDDTECVVFGEISKIEHTDYGVRMILSDVYIHLEEEVIPCNQVMVYASFNHFQVGEIHKFTGKLNMFEKARNEGNFDAYVYYQSQKIDFSMWCEESVLLGSSDAEWMKGLLYLKERLSQVFYDCMNIKPAGFFTGMILGDKTNLDEGIKDLFTMAGISHILAISGLHVSIIGRGLYQQLRKRGMGFGVAGIISGAVLVAYCFMVGNGMSAVRAVGMMILNFFAQYMGRAYDMLNALGAMVLMLLWNNPFLIEYSGFWFSVLALVGVGYVGKVLSEQVDSKKNIWNNLASSLWMCTGITLTTLPVVALCYYEVPLYSSFINFIVLPILTPIFVLALIGGIIGIWLPEIASFILVPCAWVLGLYEWLCEFVESLPWASIISGKPSEVVVVVYYLVLFGGIWLLDKCSRKGILAGCLSVICFLLIVYPKPTPFEITFLDVGQGDGIYISAEDGSAYFIDGGSTSEDLVGEYRILPFLKSKGVTRIDYWFVSHADRDHISGLLEVLESGYEVRYLVISKHAPEDEIYLELIESAEACGTKIIRMDAGEKIVSERVTFTCLYPWGTSTQDKNDASLVLELEIPDGRKAFFAGDISTEIEQLLLGKGVIDDVWFYKASHHGSKYSNSSEVLEALQPEITVISCSENNYYGHPHAETVERIENVGSEVFYTMENGQVSVKEKGKVNVRKSIEVNKFWILNVIIEKSPELLNPTNK